MPRIGLLVPSSNTTVEPEFYRALPREVTLHTARLFLTRITPESILRMVEDLEAQSRLLASAEVDVIVLGATAPSFLKGLGYDSELIAKVAAATGKRATTTSTALIEALAHLGVKRVALGSAYDDKVNGIACAFIEASGVRVVNAAGLGLIDNLVVGRLGPDTAYELGCNVNHPDAEAIVLACTNWQTMDALERLEAAVGKPVISTTQVSIWAALRMLDWRRPIEGYGRLLRDLGGQETTRQA